MEEITSLLETAQKILQVAYYKALECEEEDAQKKILRAMKNINSLI